MTLYCTDETFCEMPEMRRWDQSEVRWRARKVTNVLLSTSQSSTTYRSLPRPHLCWTLPFSFTLSSNDLRGSLHLCGITYRAFLGLGSRAPTGSIPEPPVFHGPLKLQDPGICSLSVIPLKGGRAQFTRKAHRVPDDSDADTSDAFASQDRRTNCMLDLTEWDDDHSNDP